MNPSGKYASTVCKGFVIKAGLEGFCLDGHAKTTMLYLPVQAIGESRFSCSRWLLHQSLSPLKDSYSERFLLDPQD